MAFCKRILMRRAFSATSVTVRRAVLSDFDPFDPFSRKKIKRPLTQSDLLVESRKPAYKPPVTPRWMRDTHLDLAVLKDLHWKMCRRYVNEMLSQPGQTISLGNFNRSIRAFRKYRLEAMDFIKQNPRIFQIYYQPDDRLWARPSLLLRQYLEQARRIHERHEDILVNKLVKLLYMTLDKRLPIQTIHEIKRDFGIPDDFCQSILPRYPGIFRIQQDETSGIECLVVGDRVEPPLSVLESRAQEQSFATGVTVLPTFPVCFPPTYPVCFPRELVKYRRLRRWTKDWMERPYISPYLDCRCLDTASEVMEKRNVAVAHEVLSLTVMKYITVSTFGRLGGFLKLPRNFLGMFRRHWGIFYVSRYLGYTVMLREAYREDRLVDVDPLIVVKHKFCRLLGRGNPTK